MADMLNKGLSWLSRQREAHMSREVTYLRGTSSITLPATPGRTLYEQQDRNALTVEVEMRDYLITAERLTLDAIPIEPKPGDRIVEDLAVYEVVPASPLQPAWRYSDVDQRVYRIHTKRIGELPPTP